MKGLFPRCGSRSDRVHQLAGEDRQKKIGDGSNRHAESDRKDHSRFTFPMAVKEGEDFRDCVLLTRRSGHNSRFGSGGLAMRLTGSGDCRDAKRSEICGAFA